MYKNGWLTFPAIHIFFWEFIHKSGSFQVPFLHSWRKKKLHVFSLGRGSAIFFCWYSSFVFLHVVVHLFRWHVLNAKRDFQIILLCFWNCNVVHNTSNNSRWIFSVLNVVIREKIYFFRLLSLFEFFFAHYELP